MKSLLEKISKTNYFEDITSAKSYLSSSDNQTINKLTSDKKTDFSRYNFFHASYTASLGKISEAKKIVQSALKLYPRNLLLNQYKIDLNEGKNTNSFNIYARCDSCICVYIICTFIYHTYIHTYIHVHNSTGRY